MLVRSIAALVCLGTLWQTAAACCPVVAIQGHVVNADQSVIMLWDPSTSTQHFIRKADFKSDTTDVGFIVPSPSRPTLDESGDSAFDALASITAPVIYQRGGGIPLGCSAPASYAVRGSVTVVEEKRVAGFDATVLTARSGKDLVDWLAAHGYPYSPAIEAWARPYLGGDWHFTALKVVKDPQARASAELKAASLRISFHTTRPLFPYREPDSGDSSRALGASHRLLRIYFIADTQYQGRINGTRPWSGKTVWSGDITQHRLPLLRSLNLPPSTGPDRWWLTEFEDDWPYAPAAGDVYFSAVQSRQVVNRNSTTTALDASWLVLLALGGLQMIRKTIPSSGSL